MLRTFVSLSVPDEVVDELSWMQAGLPGARWVEADNLHLTLRFVGEVEGHVFEAIARALEGVSVPPFSLTLAGLGHFPPRGQPRNVWAGVAPSESLMRLRERVERAVVSAGVAPERRKFHPHVTLARLRGTPAARVGRYLAEHSLFRSSTFEVAAFHLCTSRLHPDGPVYTREVSFRLPPPDSPF